jgi:mRNA deadenylase 3'-5' endonuclease subunit Ccr4
MDPTPPPTPPPPAATRVVHPSTSTPAFMSSVPSCLSVMHYNILASSLATRAAFPCVLHSHTVMPWSLRLPRIVAEICKYRPDVVSLVEVDQFHDIASALDAEGYIGLCGDWYRGHTTAFFFRRSSVSLVTSRCVLLEKGEGKNKIALMGLFVCKKDISFPFVFVGTHLKAKDGFEDERAQQMVSLLKETEDFQKEFNSEDVPVIVAGDLNDVPGSPVCKTIEDHSLGFQSAYDLAYKKDDSCGYFTTSKKHTADVLIRRVVDYIYYTAARMRCIGVLGIPNVWYMPEHLPTEQFPSDHLSIVAYFQSRISNGL